MVRGWYHNRKHGNRLLSINEIAKTCGISVRAVKKWFSGKMSQQDSTFQEFVEAKDLVSFLVKSGLPVSSLMLPPNTKKILFIAPEESDFQDNADKFDRICRFFSDTYNILAETSIAGKYADLSILTFAPNLVVIFVKDCDPASIKTLHLLSDIPEQKAIFFVKDSIKNDIEHQLLDLAIRTFIVADSQPVEEMLPRLRQMIDNRQ
ncbi:MAG: hypothetical protein ACWGOX_06765 [Desulforhopalus sp.]